ncbi:hypothetical protein DCAR_0625896 [Daucus carota subsp. sativus]|uniref:Uncharacterized protein n=1 Tax=Daucus carota subsp. sativus TaxID=79200 RepID=A0AAF0XE89_DAUCS|nr:hypothetical protein DCAR_0625896 [Daucus carota subsp. sativus]
MGLVVAVPGFELVQNMGLGEVIDDAPPPRPFKRKRVDTCDECGRNVVRHVPTRAISRDTGGSSSALINSFARQNFKGKTTGYETFAFYDDGALSRRAIDILDSGALMKFAPFFADVELNLEAHVKNGFFVKDILHYACLDTLGLVEFMLVDSYIQDFNAVPDDSVLMPFDQVGINMGLDDAVVPALDEDGVTHEASAGIYLAGPSTTGL